MSGKGTTFYILFVLILLFGCTSREKVPVVRTAEPPPTATPSPTATVKYPDFLLGVRPEPNRTLSLRSFVSAESGYGSTVCIKYDGFSIAQLPTVTNDVYSIKRQLLLTIDGVEISQITYLKADHTFLQTVEIHHIYHIGPYYYCWDVDLKPGPHNATIVNLADGAAYTWRFILTLEEQAEVTAAKLCEQRIMDDWRGQIGYRDIFPPYYSDDLWAVFGSQISIEPIQDPIEAWEYEEATVNVVSNGSPNNNKNVLSYDIPNNNMALLQVSDILLKFGCPQTVYGIRNVTSSTADYDATALNYSRNFGISFYFEKYPLTLQDLASFARFYDSHADRGYQARAHRIYEEGITFDWVSLEESVIE